MNQNRLIINQIAGANIVEYELDLFDNVPIPVNKSIIDIQNIAERKSDFTKTITLPGTHNNNDIFSNIFNLARSVENDNTYNFAPDFNPNLKADAILYKNGIVQIKGYLQLTNINVTDDYEIEYEVIIIGRTANLFQDLGDKKLNELDLSAFDHTWNYTNISASWTPSSVIGYYYGLIDNGLSSNQQGYYTENFKPQIFLKVIVDAIFKDAGYRYASLFFTSGKYTKLVVPTTQNKLLLTTQQVTDRTFIADRIVNSGLISLPQSGFTVLPFNNIALQSTPAGYNSTTFIYTIPTGASGVYSFACNIDMTFLYDNFNSDNCGVDYRFLIKKGSSLLFQTGRDSTTITFPSQTIKTSFQSQEVFCSAGEQIEVQLFFENNTDINNTFDLRLNTTSNFFSIVNPNLTIGSTMQLANCLPSDITQADFLLSIINLFNLYIEPTALDEKTLKIEPRDEFYTTDIIDLTNKIDVSKPIEITPLSELKYKEYLYTFSEDKDELNTIFQSKYTYPYGSYLKSVNNDFVKEQYKTKTLFAPTPLNGIRNKNPKVVFSEIVFLDSSGKRTDGTSKLRLLFAGGLSDFIGTSYFSLRDPDGTFHFIDSYPYVGHLDSITNPTFDVNFYTPQQLFYGKSSSIKYTDNNLFNLYHKKGVEEITNKDSKTVKFHVKLSENDINKLSFRSLYFIDKQYYRLYELDFDSNSEEPAVLTFLQLANVESFVGSQSNINGGGDGVAVIEIDVQRNGNTLTKGGDILLLGRENNVSGDINLINSNGNLVNGERISVLGGENNILNSTDGTYLGCEDFTSVRNGEVVIKNIDQPLLTTRILTVAELKSLHTTPIQLLASVDGYWIEIYDAYITVFFESATPVAYNNHKLHLQYSGDGTHLLEFDNGITRVTVATKQRGININDLPFKNLAVQIHSAGNLGTSGNGKALIELEYRLHRIIT
jgi:hypothetical protein